jgi:predicted esterase
VVRQAAWLLISLAAYAEDLPLGKIVDEVKCASDPSQSYALYLPSNYSANRTWPLILAFSPMARGRVPLERLQEAAEKYGYILAGSNNSRNGDSQSTTAAIRSMPADVASRFSVDVKRVYTASFSDGARVALRVADTSGKIAGVIACSAGFPDGHPRKSAPFPIYATAGTEDFNYLEMRELDRTLTTPHRLVIFEGTHDWLPASLGDDALAWLEVQAMNSGLRPHDEALEKLFVAQSSESKSDLKKELALERREEQMTMELARLEVGLGNQASRNDTLTELRDRLSDLSRRANAKDDSEDRRMARRVLRGTFARSFEQIKDPEYQKLLNDIRR